MNNDQARVKDFIDSRHWETPGVIKDLMLNIIEETGEAWNIIKWVDIPTQQELIKKHKDEFEDFIGDQLFLLYRIANIAGVDATKGFEATMSEYEQRFPVDEVKGKHANLRSGGIDHKYN